MLCAGTALTLEYIVPCILFCVPVSCQNFRVFFDVLPGSLDPHWLYRCLLVVIYGSDFKVSVSVDITTGVVG